MYDVVVHTCVCVCVLCVHGCMLQRYRPIWWDPDPLQELWICARYGPDTLAIRRSTNEMIWRFVPVNAVKTRRRFRSKTVSFHVSVYSCIIFFFIIVILSICYLYHFMWPFNLFYQYDYLYHLMRYQWASSLII